MSAGASLRKWLKSPTRKAVAGVLLLMAGCDVQLQAPETRTAITPATTVLEPSSQVATATTAAAKATETPQQTPEQRPALVVPTPTFEAITPAITALAATEYQGPLLAVASKELYIFDVGNETHHEFDSLASRPVAWSTDGCSLFFEGRDLALYRTPISRFEPLKVVDSNWRNVVPSPSGDWVAYDEASVPVVHVVRGDGSEDIELTGRYGQAAYLLGWMAAGQDVLVWSEREDAPSILAIDVHSQGVRVVADLAFLEGYAGEGENSPLEVVPWPGLLSRDSRRLLLPLRGELGNVELLVTLDFEDGGFRWLYEQPIVEFWDGLVTRWPIDRCRGPLPECRVS